MIMGVKCLLFGFVSVISFFSIVPYVLGLHHPWVTVPLFDGTVEWTGENSPLWNVVFLTELLSPGQLGDLRGC